MQDIRHLATSLDGDELVLVGAFEKRVELWSLNDPSRRSAFDTVLDFGGQRLALCGTAGDPVVLAGAWVRHGVCAYDSSGAPRWQRTDLKRPQELMPARGVGLATACLSEGPMHVLAIETGETVAKVRGARKCFTSSYQPAALTTAYERIRLVDSDTWKTTWTGPLAGAVLAAAGSPEAFMLATTSTHLRGAPGLLITVDLDGGRPWTWTAPPGSRVHSLAWSLDTGTWVGVLEYAKDATLAHWSESGELLEQHAVGRQAEYALTASDRRLITSDGAIRDARSGDITGQLL